MNFFEHQDRARRQSRWLVFVFLLSVLAVVVAIEFILLLALGVYAANLLVAAFISRPNLRRLMRVREPDAEGWRHQARRVRWVAYGMAVATGLIGFLMSTKPDLW